MPLFNSKDLIWQFWAGSSGDLLTLAKRENTTPCDICSENLTSPVRLSNQPVPGVTHKKTAVDTESLSLSYALIVPPPKFPSAASWFWQVTEVFLLVWHMGMKGPPSWFFPDSRGTATIPNPCGWDRAGAKSGLSPQGFPNRWSLLAADARVPWEWPSEKAAETEVCKIIYWA